MSPASPITDAISYNSYTSFSSEKLQAYIKKEMFFKLVDPLTKKRTLNVQDNPNISWVGLVERDAVSCVGCLLADGSIFTALHAVFDFEINAWVDFSRIFVSFVQNQKIYTYRCARVLQHGIISYNGEVHPFDYFRIAVDGQPLKTLGGGFKLDPKNHYFGASGSKEPNVVRAISGPVLRTDGRSLTITQFTSESKNTPPASYEQQETIQLTAWAFSGQQAMLFPNSTILYAIYGGSNLPSARRFGVKVSEYRAAHKRAISSPPTQGRLCAVQQEREKQPQDRFREGCLAEVRQYICDEILLDITTMEAFLNELRHVIEIQPVYYEWQCTLPVAFRDLKCMNIEEQMKYLLSGKDSVARGSCHFHRVIMKADKSLYVLHALTHCIYFIVHEFLHHHYDGNEDEKSFIDTSLLKDGSWLNSEGGDVNILNDSSASFSFESPSGGGAIRRESFNWGSSSFSNSSFSNTISATASATANNGDNTSSSLILDSIREIDFEDDGDNSSDEDVKSKHKYGKKGANTMSTMNLIPGSKKSQPKEDPIYLVDLEMDVGMDYFTTSSSSLSSSSTVEKQPCQHVQLVDYGHRRYHILPVRLERFANNTENGPIIINAKHLLAQAQRRLEMLKQQQAAQQSPSSTALGSGSNSGKVAMRRRLSRRSSASSIKSGPVMSSSGRFSPAPEATLVAASTFTTTSSTISGGSNNGKESRSSFQTF